MTDVSDLLWDRPTTIVTYATACATELFSCEVDFHLSPFLSRIHAAVARYVDSTLSADDQARMEHALFDLMMALQHRFGTQRVPSVTLVPALLGLL